MALACFIIYGAIAWYANQEAKKIILLKVVFTQGIIAAAITFGTSLLMRYLYAIPSRKSTKILVSGGITSILVFSTYIIAHRIIGTPNIFKTVFYTFIAAGPYYILFPLYLGWEEKRRSRK